MRATLFFLLLTFCPALATPQTLHSAGDISLRGLSSSDNAKILYATGNKGTILRSPDSGKTWSNLHIENTETQDFRGVRAFGPDVAYVFSVGNDNKSHIYKTTDAGKTWQIKYSDPRPAFFLDGLVCRTEKICFAISDPIDGKFPILHTEDGEHWSELPQSSEPAALPTEGLFAASNSSLILCGPNKSDIFFATGGPAARVFHSTDDGHSWTVTTTPVLSGNATAGIFSLACNDQTLVAVGGDYRKPDATQSVAAYSTDFGATWHLSDKPPSGYRSAVTAVRPKIWIAVGTNGVDISTDNALHWAPVNQLNANAVLALDPHTVVTAGLKGLITQLKIP